MRKYVVIICFSLTFVIGIAESSNAYPQILPESLFASEENSADQQDPTTITVVCGMPAEFDPTLPAALSTSEPEVPAPPSSAMQEPLVTSVVPEPSMFMLLLLGVLGLGGIGIIKRRRK